MIMFPFTLTAAQLGGVDATARAFGDLANVVGAPRAIYVRKHAGAAYTVGAGARLNVVDAAGNVLFSIGCKGLLDSTAEVKRIEVGSPSIAATAVTGVVSLEADGVVTAAATSPDVSFRVYFDDFPF